MSGITTLWGTSINCDLRKVCWYVSASTDFRPLVYYSRGYKEKHPELDDLTVPTTHIFTCLGNSVEDDLMGVLESKDKILFADDRTRIVVLDHELLAFTLAEENFLPRRSRCDFTRGATFFDTGADGFIAEVEMTDIKTGYREKTYLLYLLSENISTFDHLVGLGFANALHLVATCEGLGFGGCRMSIFEYLFTRNSYPLLRSRGFSPESMVVPSTGQANQHFQYGVNTGMIKADLIGTYIDGYTPVYKINS